MEASKPVYPTYEEVPYFGFKTVFRNGCKNIRKIKRIPISLFPIPPE